MEGPRYRLSRRRIVILAAIAVVAAGALAILLAKAVPDVYRRTAAMGPDEAAIGRFNCEIVNQVGNVLLDRSGGTRLRLEFTEDMVNAWLAQLLEEEERGGKAVPPVLYDARVGFEPGCVVVASRIGRGATSVVFSQRFALHAGSDGTLVTETGGTRVGWLPLPGGLLDYLKRALAKQLARLEATGAGEAETKGWHMTLDALDGKPVPLGEGKKRILLDRITIERGVLRVEGRRAAAPKQTSD